MQKAPYEAVTIRDMKESDLEETSKEILKRKALPERAP